jgi:hypothetical protein
MQIQNGMLRVRFRNLEGETESLEPDRVCKLAMDLWATANHFKADHSVSAYRNTFDATGSGCSVQIKGLEGMADELTSSISDKTSDHIGLTSVFTAVDTASFGDKD